MRSTLSMQSEPANPLLLRWRDVWPMQDRAQLARQAPSHNADFLGPVKNQGQEGSCTAESGAGCMEYNARRFHRDSVILSPAFLYQGERTLQGTLTQDSGAQLRYTEAALFRYGICPEREDPYTPQDFIVPWTADRLAAAQKYRITQAWWTPSLDEILNALAQRFVVQAGLVIYPSFESAPQGDVPLPTATESPLGGHAIVLFAVDWGPQRILFRNSWDTTWGNHGNGTLPFAYFQRPDLLLSARAYRY